MRQALEINGYALEFMSESQRMDRQLVMAAVRQAGGALRHASVALRADEVVDVAQPGTASEVTKTRQMSPGPFGIARRSTKRAGTTRTHKLWGCSPIFSRKWAHIYRSRRNLAKSG